MSSRKLNIAIIGVGYWGINILKAVHTNEQFHIVWLCDSFHNTLNSLPQVYDHIQRSTNYKDILEDQTVEAVFIVTPPATHFAIAKECLSHGKHIIIEKPLCYNVDQVTELQNIDTTLKIFVDYTYLFNPYVSYIKEHFANSETSPVNIEMYRRNMGLIQKNTNVVWDLAPHDISMLIYIFGKPLSVSDVISLETDAIFGVCNVIVKLTFDIGDIICNWSWVHPYKERKIIFKTNTGSFIFDELANHKLQHVKHYWNYDSTQNKVVYTNDIDTAVIVNETKQPLDCFVAHVYDVLKNEHDMHVSDEFNVIVTHVLSIINSRLHVPYLSQN